MNGRQGETESLGLILEMGPGTVPIQLSMQDCYHVELAAFPFVMRS
jgi:hypothetical protein